MDEINKFAFMCKIAQTGNTIIEIDKHNSLCVYKLGEAYGRYEEKIKANVLYNVGTRSDFFYRFICGRVDKNFLQSL